MARVRYTAEQKEKALESIKSIGVSKTSKELGITTGTLYKWQAEMTDGDGSTKKAKIANAKKLLKNDDALEKKIRQLEDENRQLRDTNDKLRKALAALVE